MRKLLFITIAVCSAVNAFGQSQPVLTNKKGLAILPEKGDFALGFGANSFFTYFGNMFNGSTNNTSPGTAFATPNQSIFGKYMKSDNMAYRVYFRFGVVNNTNSTNVPDKSPGAATGSTVTDVQKTKNNNTGLGFGIEKRRGNTRLQGFYGGEVFLNSSSGFDTRTTYGNAIENEDTGVVRTTIINSGSAFSIGVRAFAGIEFFIAPKISIGGEFGYGPAFIFRGPNEVTLESYDKTTSTLNTTKVSTSPKSRGFSMDTDNYNGIIKLLFYF